MNEHTETRLLIVAEMMEKAAAELRRVMAEIRDDGPKPVAEPPGGGEGRG